MARVIREVKHYTKDELAAMVMTSAKMEIIGSMYVGVLGEQTVEWRADGSIDVTTEHIPGNLADWKPGK